MCCITCQDDVDLVQTVQERACCTFHARNRRQLEADGVLSLAARRYTVCVKRVNRV